MKIKIAAVIVVLFLASVFGLMIYDMSEMEPSEMILCSSNEGSIFIPSKLCKYYMFNHRNIKKDVETLESGMGLAFILNGKDITDKYKLAEYYLLNGIDINGVNHYGTANLLPLHSAVLFNNIKNVRFLLKHGAATNIKPPSIDLTPLGLALALQKEQPAVDRREIIQALKNHQK